MLPGPNLIYKCPHCGNLISNGSLLSGNNLGATIYSDGKQIAPMLPEFPELTKCKQCNTTLWLSKIEELGYDDAHDESNPEWEKADKADFLEIDEYFEALENKLYENKDEEFFIRHRIWWAYNDRLRNQQEIFTDESDEWRWKENLNKLLPLLDLSDINQRIMAAEIHRNLGKFYDCITLIVDIDNDELDWILDTLVNECNNFNRWVVELETTN